MGMYPLCLALTLSSLEGLSLSVSSKYWWIGSLLWKSSLKWFGSPLFK